jgi:succinate dehydrogenase/fumarate reductase flavoprotein subunit
MSFASAVDVVVVGGGGSGLAAAVAAAEAGARVLLLEKNTALGGTTGISVGSFTAARTSLQRAAGIDDDPAHHNEDIGKFRPDLEPRNDLARRGVLTANAGATLEWLRALGLTFHGPSPEPPNRQPRMHNVIPNAKAYVATFHRRCLALGVEVRTGAVATALSRDSAGRVSRVRFAWRGTDHEVEATRGVVLACGDYANSDEIKRRYLPEEVARIEGVNPAATGEGHLLGLAAGGAVRNMDVLYGPELRFVAPPGRPFAQLLPSSPHLARLAARVLSIIPKRLLAAYVKRLLVTWTHPDDRLFAAGAILINQAGCRFCNELDRPYLQFFDQPGRVGYVILDAKVAREFSAWPNYISTAPDIAYAYLGDYRRLRPDIYREGATAEALAAAAGLPADILRNTLDSVRRCAEHAAGVVDPFGRTEWAAPFSQGPYVALGPAKAYIVMTEGGLVVDAELRVLTDAGQPIPGLYAAGCNGMGGMVLMGHGLHIAWAFTSGRIAGRHAALASR